MTSQDFCSSTVLRAVGDHLVESPPVLVVDSQRTPAHPKPGVAQVLPLSEALTATHACDRHFAPYSPSLPCRLKSESLTLGAYASMVALALDFDDHEAKRQKLPATEKWRADVAQRVGQLWQVVPNGFFYWTRGGARLVYLLDTPLVVKDDDGARAWQEFALSAMIWLEREFGLRADRACKDWTRLFRLPKATRTPGASPEDLGVSGDPNRIGAWTILTFDDAIREEAQTNLSKKYRRGKPTRKLPSGTHATRKASGPPNSVLFHLFRLREWLGPEISPGKYSVVCPFSAGHTTGEPGDTSTVLFDDGLGHCAVCCLHDSCSKRTQGDFLGAFSDVEVRLARQVRGDSHERIPIAVGPDEHRVIDDLLMVVGADASLFERGGELVEVVPGAGPLPAGAGPRVRVRAVPEASLRVELARRVAFHKPAKDGDGVVEVAPPVPIVKAVHQRGHWPRVPHLSGVVGVPILRPDGTVLDMPGFDRGSGVYFAPSGPWLTVPSNPTTQELAQALPWLQALVQDFPFADGASLSAWLAHALTFFIQYVSDAPIPTFIYDSNTPGSGKGLLARTAMRIGTGEWIAPQALPTRHEEQNKVITTLAREGARAVFFDNLTEPYGSPALEIIGTSRRWKDRLLGSNASYDGAFPAVLSVTGNNVSFRARDTVRRVLAVRLESPLERPEHRTNFSIPNLAQTVQAHQQHYVWAALVLLRAWVAVGRPDQALPHWGSYEEWSYWVRNTIVWCGLPDPFDPHSSHLEAADAETENLAELLAGFETVLTALGTTSLPLQKLLEVLDEDSGRQPGARRFGALREAVLALGGTNALRSTDDLGRVFRRYRGRRAGGRKLERGKKVTGIRHWTVLAVGGPGGHGGRPGGQAASANSEVSEPSHDAPIAGTSTTPTVPGPPYGGARSSSGDIS